jgi:hypothetical protein
MMPAWAWSTVVVTVEERQSNMNKLSQKPAAHPFGLCGSHAIAPAENDDVKYLGLHESNGTARDDDFCKSHDYDKQTTVYIHRLTLTPSPTTDQTETLSLLETKIFSFVGCHFTAVGTVLLLELLSLN